MRQSLHFRKITGTLKQFVQTLYMNEQSQEIQFEIKIGLIFSKK